MATVLEDALSRWRTSRTAGDARAVDEAAAIALRDWTPPLAGDGAGWQRAARDDAQRSWACTNLLADLPASRRKRLEALTKRLETLAELPADPRIALALARATRPLASELANYGVFVAWRDALTRSCDERARTEIEDALPAVTMPVARILWPLVEPVTPVGRQTHEILSLWNEVVAHPFDAGARVVLADALISRGDPRGELISLQLAPDTAESEARIARLLHVHGSTWLGPMRRAVGSAQFRGGFVTRIDLSFGPRIDGEALAALLADDMLATIEEIRAASMDFQWMRSPRMTALRSLDITGPQIVAALEDTPLMLDHVAITEDFGSNRDRFALVWPRARPLLERLPLRTLSLPAYALDVVTPDWLERLRGVTLGGTIRTNLPLWSQMPATCSLALTRYSEIAPCRAAPWDAWLELRREAREVVAHLAGEWLLTSLDDTLAALPRDVARFEVSDAAPAFVARLERAVAPRPVTLVPSRYRTGNV